VPRHGAGVGADAQAEPWAYSSQEEILKDLLRNRDAAAISKSSRASSSGWGFRFDDGFVRHTFFGGRGVVFGGSSSAAPSRAAGLGRGRGPAPSGGGQSRGGPGWKVAGHPEITDTPNRPASLTWIGRALQGLGRMARLALGSGRRSEDVTQEFLDHADGGPGRGQEALPLLPGRRGRGGHRGPFPRASGRDQASPARQGAHEQGGAPGDLYLRIHVTE